MTLAEMLGIFLVPFGWPFLLYLALQVYLPIRTKGSKLFWFSLVPLIGSLPVLWFTYELGREESNLWPLFLILGGVAFALWEVVVFIIMMVKSQQQARKTSGL